MLLEQPVQVVPLELLLSLLPELVQEVLQAPKLTPLAVLESLAQQTAQRRLEVPAVINILRQPGEQLTGVGELDLPDFHPSGCRGAGPQTSPGA